jgi:hypothetical protein
MSHTLAAVGAGKDAANLLSHYLATYVNNVTGVINYYGTAVGEYGKLLHAAADVGTMVVADSAESDRTDGGGGTRSDRDVEHGDANITASHTSTNASHSRSSALHASANAQLKWMEDNAKVLGAMVQHILNLRSNATSAEHLEASKGLLWGCPEADLCYQPEGIVLVFFEMILCSLDDVFNAIGIHDFAGSDARLYVYVFSNTPGLLCCVTSSVW